LILGLVYCFLIVISLFLTFKADYSPALMARIILEQHLLYTRYRDRPSKLLARPHWAVSYTLNFTKNDDVFLKKNRFNFVLEERRRTNLVLILCIKLDLANL